MKNLEKLISDYKRKIQILELDIEKQLKTVRAERKRCREENIPTSEDVDYTWESRDLNALQDKLNTLIQFRVDLEGLQESI